ncbi:hypothetical protein JW826_03960 [Candidatus Woesearchaeota archaeon]|nr:hypothetical protein [Candidatus Woesearchaeota archaeon]
MRRGSIDIGINFTIIIIIGLVILGLALMFVLDVFKFAHEKVPDSAPEIIFHASPDNMLYPEGKELKIKPGDSTELLVSVYNYEWSEEDDVSLAFDACRSEDGIPEEGLSLASIAQKITWQRDKGYLAIVKVADSVMPGIYVCTIQAGLLDSTGFVMTSMPYHTRQVSINVI